MTYPYEVNTETVHMNGDDLFARVSCQMRNVLSTQITLVLFIALSTGWAKKVIPLVQCNVMHERYHVFGPPCINAPQTDVVLVLSSTKMAHQYTTTSYCRIHRFFSKAFDVVSHNKLIARLYSYGVRGPVLLWIKNFLSNRTQQTRVEVSLSDVVSLLSGIVQGSGIGPVLFLTYINELANILESYGVHVKLFADDVKLYLQITNDVDVARLQCAIDALTGWADEWQLSVSVNKCCTLNIGRAICDTNLTINGSVLPTVESARDLGAVSYTHLTLPTIYSV